jgi:hypothetical protein
MNTRKEPAMATTPESFVDALNSAFGKQTTQRSAHAWTIRPLPPPRLSRSPSPSNPRQSEED